MRPHGDIDRKRVTLLYRPIDSARAARIVEQDKRNADFRVNSSARPSARALVEQRAAAATAAEEARGAGPVNFGMLVTATVTSAERLAAARHAIEHLAPTARIMLRPVHGSQTARSRPHCHSGSCFPATSGSPRNCGSRCEAPRNQADAGASGATARHAAGPRPRGVGLRAGR